MATNKNILSGVIFATILAVVILVLSYFPILKNLNWGKIEYLPAQVVTVTGEAKTQQKNQVASFTAGVSTTNDNKDTAVSEVNKKVQELIDSIKTFGISQDNIKTQNLSIYQNEEYYYDNGTQKSRPGQWRVSNSIDIKLKNTERASEFSDLLSRSGANQVYGPNFTLDDTGDAEKGLLEEAIKDAQEKAQIIALASGKTLGEVVSVSEGSSQPVYPLFSTREMGGGGAPPVEPGTGTVYKSVTVIFELR